MGYFHDLSSKIPFQQVIFIVYVEQVSKAIVQQITHRSHLEIVLPDFNDTGQTVRRMEVPQNFTPTLAEHKSKDLPLASYLKKKKKKN